MIKSDWDMQKTNPTKSQKSSHAQTLHCATEKYVGLSKKWWQL